MRIARCFCWVLKKGNMAGWLTGFARGLTLVVVLFPGTVWTQTQAGSGTTQRRGARYDQQIRESVAKLLTSKADYKNVKADVDDATVTLTGNVELDSTRRFLVQRARRIAHVNGVQNELVLDPPAMEDKTLYGHVQQELEDAGFKTLTIKAHEGAVTLLGIVRTVQDRERALRIARETKGVKEVESRLTVAEK